MGIYLAEQALVFAEALLVGAALGLLYDVFRITRVAFPTAPGVVFAEDVLFFIICAVVTFFFGLTVIDGALRIFLILGELLGAIFYYFTAGRLVMGISKKIIAAIKAVINFIVKWIFRPVWSAIYHITAVLVRPFIFLKNLLKKILQKAKFHLKVKRKVLYNQLNTRFKAKRKIKKHKVRVNGQKQKKQKQKSNK